MSEQHPALLEWLRWRQGEPLWYPSPGLAPLEVALGFEWLVETYGKESINTVADAHSQALALMSVGMD